MSTELSNHNAVPAGLLPELSTPYVASVLRVGHIPPYRGFP
jgi:hypothetical protein